jgi:AraC-like DNA-binding protein
MPSAYFRLALRRFGSTAEKVARILDGTGVGEVSASRSDGAEEEIELWQQFRQVRNLNEVGPRGWALDLGASLGAAGHGTLGAATVSATILEDALTTLERFAHVRSPYFRLSSQRVNDHFVLRIESQLRIDAAIWTPLVETLVASIQGLIEASLGGPMMEGRFELDYEFPEHGPRYTELLHAPVAFGCDAVAVVLPSYWLGLACPFADPALHRSSLDRLAAAEARLDGDRYIVAQVQRVLAGGTSSNLDMDLVASNLHLSRRTLIRRLGESGTSFRELLDEHRRKRAAELLADPHLTAAEVGDRLGYADAASFGRACRRWFGVGPRAYRERKDAS